MKKFIEKLIGRLEEQQAELENEMHRLRSRDYTLPCSYDITDIKEIASESFKESIEIVNELAEEYKNTNIITDFLQYARDNADNYDTNEGWSLSDLIDLSIKYSEEHINTSTDTTTTNADRIRSMNDEELAELITSGELSAICPMCDFYGKDLCYIENDNEEKNCSKGILNWLQSEVEGATENE